MLCNKTCELSECDMLRLCMWSTPPPLPYERGLALKPNLMSTKPISFALGYSAANQNRVFAKSVLSLFEYFFPYTRNTYEECKVKLLQLSFRMSVPEEESSKKRSDVFSSIFHSYVSTRQLM